MKLKIIDVRKEYRALYEKALNQFKNIPKNKFHNSTLLPSWTISDIISHLTGNALAKISDINRMNNNEENPKIDFKSLSLIIQENNEKWISVLNSLEQNTLVELFSFAYGKLISKFEEIKDLKQKAVHDVAWFSDDTSPYWLDMAREYTELWMHTAQISDALNKDFPFEKPFLNLFYKITLLALNRTFKEYKDELNIEVHINKEIFHYHNHKGFFTQNGQPNTLISICDRSAWKLLSGISLSTEELEAIKIEGDQAIGKQFLQIESVMVKAG